MAIAYELSKKRLLLKTGRNYKLQSCFLTINAGFKIRHFEKNSRGKKLKTQGKNSITQGNYQGFHQKFCYVPTTLLNNSCPIIACYFKCPE